jgi:serine/threonine-protein kinase
MVLLEVQQVHKSFTGGQKFVFIATCKDYICAIKMFRFGFGEREDREIKFYIENSKLKGIPTILEVVEHNKETIVIEEFIDGEPLNGITDRYVSNGPIIAKLITDIADIMTPIWRENKTHRDIKPENIIIQPDGTPVIIDFGIFKDSALTTITHTGFQPHSWAFAAPEQHLGNKEHISYRTDFFALGVLAYYLYYQELPFGQTQDAIMKKMASQDLDYSSEDGCQLNDFFEAVLQFPVSARPRNVEILKEGLKI